MRLEALNLTDSLAKKELICSMYVGNGSSDF